MSSRQQRPQGGQQRRTTGENQSLPLVKGAVYGAASYIVGYVIFFSLAIGVETDVFENAGEDLMQAVGWFYHNAQFVDVEYSTGRMFNFFNEANIIEALSIPAIVYRAIPVILLVVYGYQLVNSLGVRTPEQGAKFGATIAVGVTIFAVLGTFVFSVSGSTYSASAQPELLTSVLIMGITYPVIFGAIGGYLAGS